eukprot:g31035.t1
MADGVTDSVAVSEAGRVVGFSGSDAHGVVSEVEEAVHGMATNLSRSGSLGNAGVASVAFLVAVAAIFASALAATGAAAAAGAGIAVLAATGAALTGVRSGDEPCWASHCGRQAGV